MIISFQIILTLEISMPFPFQVILIFGATSYLLTALLFLTTRNMPGINNGASWWSLSSIFAALGYTILLVAGLKGRPDIGEAIYNMCFVVWGLGLYIGSRNFLGLKTQKVLLLFFSFIITVWLYYFYFISYHFLFSAIVVSGFIGFLNLHLAYTFFRYISKKNKLHYAIIITLSISGLHWLDYPFLRPIEAIAPMGFTLCAVSSIIISALFASLVIIQFKNRMITMSKEALEIANHDPLTGLGNRNALESKFNTMLENSILQNKKVALLFLDLDNFKPVNDTLGHKIGDEILVTISDKIRSLVKDTHHIARVGGDEFIIIVDELNIDDKKTINTLCEDIIKKVSEPIVINGYTCDIGVSIGISYTCEEINLDSLIQQADKAMYEAKTKGKNRYLENFS